MKPTYLFALLLILTTALLPASCGHTPDKPSRFWDTGNDTVDSLLTLADYYELINNTGGEKREELDSTLMAVAAMKEATPSASKLAEIWARGMSLSTLYSDIRQLDSIVKDSTNVTKSPYLVARARLEMASRMDKPKEQNQIYFDLVEYFTKTRDSVRVVDLLMKIDSAYAETCDYSTPVECIQMARPIIPDSLPKIHLNMDFNQIILLRAYKRDEDRYKRFIDSVKCTPLIAAEPEFGTLLYSDLYNITGNPTFMDTAATYYAHIANKNDWIASVYRLYQLRLFDERGLADSAQMRCVELKTRVRDGSRSNLEVIPELIRHYTHTGDSAAIPPLRRQLTKDSTSFVAMHKANEMRHINASRDMSWLKEILHPKEKDIDSNKWLWLSIGIVAVIAGVSLSLYRHRRKSSLQRPQPEELPADNADREMVAEHLVSATNDTEEKSTALGGFDIAFSRVRPGFTDKLLALHPKLTAYELRLCSLLSIGLDTKEIARILSINPDSVKKSRQRLRAKLGIPSDMTFIEYFRNLPQ